MIKLPGFPRTFTSRQVECVSCHNLIAIAEAFFEENQPEGGRPSAPEPLPDNDRWRIPADRAADVQLRYQETRSSRPVAPPTSSTHSSRTTHNTTPAANYDNDLCCPRCGADNRNWVQIQNRHSTLSILERFNSSKLPQILYAMAFAVIGAIILLAIFNPSWLPKQIIPLTGGFIVAGAAVVALLKLSGSVFPDERGQRVLLGAGCTAVLIAWVSFALIVFRAPNSVWQQAVPLGLTVLAAGILPAWAFASDWKDTFRAVREHRSLPEQFRSPVWRFVGGGVVLSLFSGIVVPVLLYMVFPAVFGVIFELPEKSPIISVQEDLSHIQEKLSQWQIQEDTPDEANQKPIQLEELISQTNPKLLSDEQQLSELRKLIAQLEKKDAVPPGLMKEIRAGIEGLKETEAELKIFVDGQKKPSLLLPPTISWQFYFLWLFVAGVNTFLSTAAGAVARLGFARRVNAQLPPPIFHSVAAMTRVVVWEAKQALEVRGVIMDYVQWTAVARNELGGITLTGIHRDQPKLKVQEVAIGRRVPAQVYTITSDRWARIVDAVIYSTVAGHAPRVPATDISQDFFAEIDQRAYQNLRP
ncbi:MAG: hypothetical protein ACE5FD_08495 [Anaerolineae bacterium]